MKTDALGDACRWRGRVFARNRSQPHYAAPLTCVFTPMLVQAIRHLRAMRISSLHFGVAASRVIVSFWCRHRNPPV